MGRPRAEGRPRRSAAVHALVGGIELQITYHPISEKNDVRFEPQRVDPIRLPIRTPGGTT